MSTILKSNVFADSKLELVYDWHETMAIWLRVFRNLLEIMIRLIPWFINWSRLNFAVQQQQQSQWCWAAVATSTSLYYDPASTWSQCGLVNDQLGQTTCCQNGGLPQCNQPWVLSKALTRTGNLSNYIAAAVDIATVINEIGNSRLMAVRIGWNVGKPTETGHFLVLEGYRPIDEFVAVEDPFHGASDISIATLTAGYYGSQWTHTYYTKA